MARKQDTALAVAKPEPVPDHEGMWSVGQAAAYIGIQKGSFTAAIKRYDYLKAAQVQDKYPGTEMTRNRIHPDAVRRFAKERQENPRQSASGMKRYSALLFDSEVDEAARVLGDAFGREIKIERVYKGKRGASPNGMDNSHETQRLEDTAWDADEVPA